MDAPSQVTDTRLDQRTHATLRGRAFVWGCAAAAFLVLAYVSVLAAANSLEHAFEDFVLLWYWMVPLIVGFGIQVGLFTYLRGAPVRHGTLGSGGVATSGSVSTVAMVACCAHHLTDVLPGFFSEPGFTEQDRLTVSLSAAPEYYRSRGSGSVLIAPFFRLDSADPERTHIDVRELIWQRVSNDWELRAGIGKTSRVFSSSGSSCTRTCTPD